MSKVRVEKVQAAIMQEISKMFLFDVKDAKISGASVTGVEVSPDLSYAKVFVSLIGSDEEQEQCLAALDRAKGYFRSEIAQRIRLRYAPEIHFAKDDSQAYSDHIEELLAKIKQEKHHDEES